VGVQTITWLLISLVLVLAAYGMLVAELQSAFPVEDRPHEGVKLSFGQLVSAATAVPHRLASPNCLGETLAATDLVHRVPCPARQAGRGVDRCRPEAVRERFLTEAEFRAEQATGTVGVWRRR
jgi:hypothetical protein